MPHFTRKDKKAFLDVLAAKAGNITEACKETSIPRRSHYVWLKEKWYAQRVEEINEIDVDVAESVVKQAIYRERDVKTAEWFLERKGRHRGYGTRQELQLDAQTAQESLAKIAEAMIARDTSSAEAQPGASG